MSEYDHLTTDEILARIDMVKSHINQEQVDALTWRLNLDNCERNISRWQGTLGELFKAQAKAMNRVEVS